MLAPPASSWPETLEWGSVARSGRHDVVLRCGLTRAAAALRQTAFAALDDMPPSTLCILYVRRDGWEHWRLAGGGWNVGQHSLRSTTCRPPLCAIERFRIQSVAEANDLQFSAQGGGDGGAPQSPPEMGKAGPIRRRLGAKRPPSEARSGRHDVGLRYGLTRAAAALKQTAYAALDAMPPSTLCIGALPHSICS